jgi:hypothetical protein
MTAGTNLWLSVTAGAYAEAVSGYVQQVVGFSVSATIAAINVQRELRIANVGYDTGDTRAAYIAVLQKTAAGSGDAGRFLHRVMASIAAANAHGIHATVAFDDHGTVTGQAAAGRFTLESTAHTQTLTGTLSPLIVESFLGADTTLPARTAFIRAVNLTAVVIPYLFRLPTAASTGILATHTTQVMSHSIRIIDDAGAVRYIMCTATAGDRDGGA